MVKRISECFNLNKTQAELDFVDVYAFRDMPLFVDPLPFSQRVDELSQNCHTTITAYFQLLIDCIRTGDDQKALSLLMRLREPNETRLGLSRNKPQGAGIGGLQAR